MERIIPMDEANPLEQISEIKYNNEGPVWAVMEI